MSPARKSPWFHPDNRTGVTISWVLLSAILLFYLFVGLEGILADINDYDVFYQAGQWASQRDPMLYENDSREGRHFLYPPTGAFLLIPLSWPPYALSGVIFTLLRAGAVVLIAWVMLRWCRDEGWLGGGVAPTWPVLVSLIACFRFMRTDFGNGQINVILVAVALAGLRLSLARPVGRQWVGGALVTAAAAVKASPLLFLGVPLLHRRLHALAGALVALAVIGGASTLWFGRDLSASLWRQWDEAVSKMFRDKIDEEEPVSLPEVVATTAGLILHREERLHERLWGAAAVPMRLFHPVNDEMIELMAEASIPHRDALRRWWRYEALGLGLLFLGIRLWRSRTGRGVSPLWDVAIVGVGLLLLTPATRKAHVTAVWPGVLALATLLLTRRDVRQPRWVPALAALGGVMLVVSRSLPLDLLIPGHAANPAIFVALVVVALALSGVRLPPRDSGRSRGSCRASDEAGVGEIRG